ncbi:MAG: LOG family protein [Candidatus Doudnabacteria bacterium]|nr:LOG family protein [Candidatus Doudnabacteria bacterium]
MKTSKGQSIKICVSGAAAGKSIARAARDAERLGAMIAKQGAMLLTGATTGLPLYAARGAKRAGGFVFGFSPAGTRAEHTKKYRLPLNFLDLVVFTGAGYSGRNLILTRSSDAVIVVGGRIGTLNEFTVAFEDRKVIGILEGSGGITDEIKDILKVAGKGKRHVVFASDPDKLIKKVIAEVKLSGRHNHIQGRREA